MTDEPYAGSELHVTVCKHVVYTLVLHRKYILFILRHIIGHIHTCIYSKTGCFFNKEISEFNLKKKKNRKRGHFPTRDLRRPRKAYKAMGTHTNIMHDNHQYRPTGSTGWN